MKIYSLTKLEKLVLIGLCIEGATGVIGGSLILSEGRPYLTLAILAIGAMATKTVGYITKKENEANLKESQEETASAKQ